MHPAADGDVLLPERVELAEEPLYGSIVDDNDIGKLGPLRISRLDAHPAHRIVDLTAKSDGPSNPHCLGGYDNQDDICELSEDRCLDKERHLEHHRERRLGHQPELFDGDADITGDDRVNDGVEPSRACWRRESSSRQCGPVETTVGKQDVFTAELGSDPTEHGRTRG